MRVEIASLSSSVTLGSKNVCQLGVPEQNIHPIATTCTKYLCIQCISKTLTILRIANTLTVNLFSRCHTVFLRTVMNYCHTALLLIFTSVSDLKVIITCICVYLTLLVIEISAPHC